MACLRIYLKEDFRWSYSLLDAEMRIGRSRENHLVLPHPEVSRHQAVIRQNGSFFEISDESGKSLDINGALSQKAILKDGDVIRIGNYRLVFESEQALDVGTDTMAWEPTLDLARSAASTVIGAYELVVTGGLSQGDRISLSESVISVGRSARCDLSLLDKTISNVHLEFEVSPVGVHLRDLGSTNGTYVDGQRIQSVMVNVGSEIYLGKSILKVFSEEETLSEQPPGLGQMIGQSEKMLAVFRMIQKGAKGDVPILIQGETGCGKEGVAKEIHRLSTRAEGPLIVLDCSAIPKELIESELFGHEKGAFTGAVSRRKGAFEQANGGTIFLDEVGELPIEMQPKLLRVLEEKRFKRIGGSELLRSDFRIVAATNRWLDKEVMAGHFREDLYFRLCVIPLTLPPLRERLDDIPYLVTHFLKGKSLQVPKEVMDRLMEHHWPGNVRELRNVLERGVVMMDGNSLCVDDLLFMRSGKQSGNPMPWQEDAEAPAQTLEEVEKQVIRRALTTHKGDKKAVSKALGIALSTLYEKLRRYQIS